MSHKSISKMIQVQRKSRMWYSAQNASVKFPLHGALKCDPLGSKSFALHTMCALTHTQKEMQLTSMYQCISILHWEWSSGLSPKFHTPKMLGISTPSQAPKRNMNPNHGLFLQSLRLPTAKSAASGLEKWKVIINAIYYIQRSKATEIPQKYEYWYVYIYIIIIIYTE